MVFEKEKQIKEIWQWLGCKEQHSNGVTNKEVMLKFGEDYKNAWKTIKSRYKTENGIFYEDGKWCRWHKNPF